VRYSAQISLLSCHRVDSAMFFNFFLGSQGKNLGSSSLEIGWKELIELWLFEALDRESTQSNNIAQLLIVYL